MSAERLLVLLLRLGGGLLLCALPFVFTPVAWMASTHRWLGLGEFPESTLVEYLTRSIATLFAVHGGVLLVASLDVRRHRALVRYLGVVNLILGPLVLGIDLHAGLPAWWVWMEGPPVLVSGIVLLLLLGRLDAD